uniref:Ycf80 n=1 Tax=Sarcopeltis skottsbergii TaxID=2765380 RepID=A0A7M1VIA9_SARSK|nr:hypothetical protein [Sarcopeltis skottsbergii]
MSLSNPMFIQNLFNNNLIVNNQFLFIPRKVKNRLASIHENHNIASKNHKLSIIANKTSYLNPKINSFANKEFVSRNFITKLINKYWQETIFLSQPSILSDMYSSQLQSDGLAVYKNRYKKFIFHFSKALISGRIETTLEQSKEINNLSNNLTEIKYIWKKGFNFSRPKNFVKFKNQPNFFTSSQLAVVKKLQQSKFPVFTIINNYNQIIVTEPSDELINQEGLVDQLYQFYCNSIVGKTNNRLTHEALFFVNPEDTLEYQESIKNKYIYKSNYANFNIFTTGLDFYYKLVRLSPLKVQFHLIPDLQELGNLTYKYQYKRNIAFHINQKYGKNFFQGQPIYIIQPVLSKHKKTRQKDLINYNYYLNNNVKYETVFLNYEVALLAWQKFVIQNNNYRLPYIPNILVYNLEDFLKFYEQKEKIDKKNLLFVPSQQSYRFIKNNISNKSQQHIPQKLSKKFLRFQIIAKRILWSLTSRQPTNL